MHAEGGWRQGFARAARIGRASLPAGEPCWAASGPVGRRDRCHIVIVISWAPCGWVLSSAAKGSKHAPVLVLTVHRANAAGAAHARVTSR